MERNLRNGLLNLVVLLAIGAASTILARHSDTLAGQAAIFYWGLGVLVLAISYFQMRLEDAERLEKLEFEEINKTAASASLFNTTDSEVFPARRSREQFERFFVPGFTFVVFLVQAGGSYVLWNWLSKLVPVAIKQGTVAMSLFGLFALILFLLGKYAVGLTRLEGARLLRAGANYLLLGAYVSFLVTACIAAAQLGFPKLDIYAARALAGVLGLMALETLITLVLEIYRPRVRGKVGRVLYDSRLVGLLAEPEGLFTTAAHALDYQFGFKVSETWFYRFLEKALVWLVLLQLGVLVLSTSFFFISPGEQGVVERFGRPVGDGAVLDPGLHFKLPWPIDKVFRESTRRVQSFTVGVAAGEEEEHERAVLWTAVHAKDEANWLVASRRDQVQSAFQGDRPGEQGVPADLINVSVPVQFEISDLRAWMYNHADATNLLQKIATRELILYLTSTDLVTVMSTGRSEAADTLRKRIEAQAEEQKLGVRIIYVGLQDLHPPVKVAPEFEKVVAVVQENEARREEARGYALRVVAEAQAEAIRKLNEMRAYSNRVVSVSRAQASQFGNQIAAFRSSPAVYLARTYLQTLVRGTTNANKYISTLTNQHDLYQLNLEQKVRRDLLDDLSVPPPAR